MTPSFGFIFDFSAPLPWARSPHYWWHQLLEIAKEVEALNYGSIWVGEHHFTDDSFSTSPLQTLAALSQITSRIRLGTYVLLLPLHHPIRVAEEAAGADILSNGRFDLGLGLGYRQAEMIGYGVKRSHRPSLYDEGIEIIRRAWTQNDAGFEGRHYSFEHLNVTPKPVQKPHPPIFLAARGEVPARRAGKLGLNLHLMGGSSIRRIYEDELKAQGKDPADFRVSIFKPIFVARDPEQALARYHDQFAYFTARHGGWVGENQDLAYDTEIHRTWTDTSNPLSGMSYLYGTPEKCLDELRALYERKPFTDFIAPITAPYQAEGILDSIRLFAREVMTPFQEEVALRESAPAGGGN